MCYELYWAISTLPSGGFSYGRKIKKPVDIRKSLPFPEKAPFPIVPFFTFGGAFFSFRVFLLFAAGLKAPSLLLDTFA